MSQLKHIDIAHLLYKLALLIEFGITSEEHTQALAFPSIGEQQDKRVLIALAIHCVKRPHHTSRNAPISTVSPRATCRYVTPGRFRTSEGAPSSASAATAMDPTEN